MVWGARRGRPDGAGGRAGAPTRRAHALYAPGPGVGAAPMDTLGPPKRRAEPKPYAAADFRSDVAWARGGGEVSWAHRRGAVRARAHLPLQARAQLVPRAGCADGERAPLIGEPDRRAETERRLRHLSRVWLLARRAAVVIRAGAGRARLAAERGARAPEALLGAECEGGRLLLPVGCVVLTVNG